MYKKILIFILGFIIIFSPAFLVKAEVEFNGLVPKCNTGKITTTPAVTETRKIDGKDVIVTITPEKTQYENPCDFNMLMLGINKFINFLVVVLATPLFALILVYVGWLYLSDRGSSENVKKAKTILKNAFFGYIIALAAWLIVKTILLGLGFTGNSFLS